MQKSHLTLSVLSSALVFLLANGTVEARGRTTYSTPIAQRVDSYNPAMLFRGGATRIKVALQNVSHVAQTVTVTSEQTSRVEEVAFDIIGGVPQTAALSNWITNPSSPMFKVRQTSHTSHFQTLILSSLESNYVNFVVSCAYNNSSTPSCDYTSEINLVTAPNAANSNGTSISTVTTIRVDVAEDMGAILGDISLQEIEAGSLSLPVMQTNRPLNGGRPF